MYYNIILIQRDTLMTTQEKQAQRLQDVMLVVNNYEQSELVDLVSDLLSQSPIITNVVYGMVCEEQYNGH